MMVENQIGSVPKVSRESLMVVLNALLSLLFLASMMRVLSVSSLFLERRQDHSPLASALPGLTGEAASLRAISPPFSLS